MFNYGVHKLLSRFLLPTGHSGVAWIVKSKPVQLEVVSMPGRIAVKRPQGHDYDLSAFS